MKQWFLRCQQQRAVNLETEKNEVSSVVASVCRLERVSRPCPREGFSRQSPADSLSLKGRSENLETRVYRTKSAGKKKKLHKERIQRLQ